MGIMIPIGNIMRVWAIDCRGEVEGYPSTLVHDGMDH